MSNLNKRAISDAISDAIKTDNIILKYGINILIMSSVAVIYDQLPVIKEKIRDLYARNNTYATLYLTASEMYINNGKKEKVFSDSYLAWLSLFRKEINEKNNNIKEVKSIFCNNSDKKKYNSYLLPANYTKILIDTDPDIWFEYWHKKVYIDKWYGKIEHYLKISSNSNLDKLLLYNDQLTTQYLKNESEKFIQKSHIFDFDNGTWSEAEYKSNINIDYIWIEEKKLFLKKYNDFMLGEQLYIKRQVPWTFSCLLYGEPGCGKTSIIKSIINKDKKINIISHLIVVPFGMIKTRSAFRQILLDEKINNHYIPYNRRVYIFEDFDACENNILYKRDNLKDREDHQSVCYDQPGLSDDKKKKEKEKEKEPPIVLADILNTLDGLIERSGQRIFWTTNASLDIFDPAFLRSGRMNLKLKLSKCNTKGIKFMLEHYYKCSISDDIIKKKINKKFSPAMIKEVCSESYNILDCIKNLQKLY